MDAETALSIFFGSVLAVFSVFLVGFSLLRRDRTPTAANQPGPTGTDDPDLSDIFDAIGTLELEYQLGRMTEDDFQTQYQAYRIQAATTLKEQLEAGLGDPSWLLEQEVLLARNVMDESTAVLCPDCSAPVGDNSANCPQCGAEMVSRP